MPRINTILVITIIALLPLSCGCFIHHQSESAAPGTARVDPSTQEGTPRTTGGPSSDQGKGVMGTTGEAIGGVVLFPFRAIGQAFTPSNKPE
jgi:hypothetical protein